MTAENSPRTKPATQPPTTSAAATSELADASTKDLGHECAALSLAETTMTIGQCEPAADLFRALANPTRVAIIKHLTDYTPLCVHDLVALLDLPQPMVSQHLKVLRDAGLVHRGRRGREAAYSLVDDHVAHIVGDAVIHTGEPLARSS